jgi:hypothetical protein
MKLQNLVNHIVFVLDESSSMGHHARDVVSVFDSQIKFLSRRSQELNQETRVSIYKFSDKVECIIYDTDVMRLPSLNGLYRPNGMTALLDATGQAIEDLKLTPEIYGDHAFLMYVLTDGEENSSRRFRAGDIKQAINRLADNWTVAVLVPDKTGEFEAKKFGFDPDNISIWDTVKNKAIEEVGRTIQAATENFFQARAGGAKNTKGRGLFKLNTNISTKDVTKSLDVLSPSDYIVINVRADGPIKGTVESWTKSPYVHGSSYYQLTKKETIQASKNILIKNTKNGKVYEGKNARNMLGLPNSEVKVEPAQLSGFQIFVQSSSVNRKLLKGTELIVLV